MTHKERMDKRNEFLRTVEVGTEICITNCNNPLNGLFGGLFGYDEKQDSICEIKKVHALVDIDGDKFIFFKEDDSLRVFTMEGQQVFINRSVFNNLPELWEPTDELRSLTMKMKFSKDIKGIDWRSFKDDKIKDLINIINGEFTRIAEEVEKAKEESERKKKEAEEERNKNDSTRSLVHTGLSRNMISQFSEIESVRQIVSAKDIIWGKDEVTLNECQINQLLSLVKEDDKEEGEEDERRV